MRCIAIDDEPLALELLVDNISKLPYLHLVAQCENALEAMKIMEKESVDLIFLDIQMPGLTGLQFIQSMTVKPMIILVTAYEKYALQGFDLEVTDYLVKPVPLDRFVKACNKAKELFELKKQTRTDNDDDYFFVNVEYRQVKILYADIIYIEGFKDYIKIHLKSLPNPVVTRLPMKTIEEQLPAKAFMRIHKSYIVSTTFVTATTKSSVLLGNLELPVSDSYKENMLLLTGKK